MDVNKILQKMLLNPDPTLNEEDRGDSDQMVEEFIAEYENLDSTLDQLDSCLDDLEKQNDDIVEQLQALLVENRATREAFKAERMAEGDSGSSLPERDSNFRQEDCPQPSTSNQATDESVKQGLVQGGSDLFAEGCKESSTISTDSGHRLNDPKGHKDREES